MSNVDSIRFQVLRNRALPPEDNDRERLFVSHLCRALVDARRTNDATEAILISRYGFTAAELALYGEAAKDRATEHWVRHNRIEQAAA